jgi:inosine/xanthosine triphosphatase
MNIAVGSLNKTKVGAVKQAFLGEKVTIIPVSVPSGVSAQPFSDEETMQGAINRSKKALEETEAEIGIGLEGGVVETEYGLFLCNWGALATHSGLTVVAGGARIKLPDEFLEPLKEGLELSEVMDAYTKRNDIRSNEGAVGIFTNGYINREEMFTHVAKLLVGQYKYQTKE